MASPKDARQCQALQDELDRTRSDLVAAKTREIELKARISQLQSQLLTVESLTRREVVLEMEQAIHEMQQSYRKNIQLLQDTNEEIIGSKNDVIRSMRRAVSEPRNQPEVAIIAVKKHKKHKKRRKHLQTCSPIANRTRKRLKDCA